MIMVSYIDDPKDKELTLDSFLILIKHVNKS